MGFSTAKKQSRPKQGWKKLVLLIGALAGGLLGLFAIALFALPAICPSCAGWIAVPPPGATTQAPVDNRGNLQVGTNPGEQAPDFTLTDIDGNGLKLSELRGRPTIVYFSASWCLPCIPETQELARLKARYSNLEVIWISVDPAGDSPQSLREHRRKYAREDFIYALDMSSNAVARQYQVSALGTFYLLDRNQLVVFRGRAFGGHTGFSASTGAGGEVIR